MIIQDKIQALLGPTIESMGYVLWGCDYLAQGQHSLLRIYIDKKEGIGIEDCERVSRQVSALLDVDDPISGHYSLEVSSPGMPRPLFRREQYQDYIGQDVQLKLLTPIAGKRKFTGALVSVGEEVIVVDLGENLQEVPFSNIVKAYLNC